MELWKITEFVCYLVEVDRIKDFADKEVGQQHLTINIYIIIVCTVS